MRWSLLVALAAGASACCATDEETLNYTVNWPSGLSLGEASLRARSAGERWELEFEIDAAVPGYAVQDRYRSIARPDLCALELEKRFVHGRKRGHERTSFDAERGVALRETLGGGGKTEMAAPGCPRDALAYLYYVRRELAQGRLPRSQEVFFGARYQVNLEYRGFHTVTVNEQRMQADCYEAMVKGPASQHSFQIYFARDPARTPLLVRLSLPLGIFSMELVR
ncbi:MAG: DUF3108 domain-containing protein [Bryobacterales bacterium]|nr:DUF3108 domain-containing protein [Bryobacteraceae bacterium]MDW8130149.1 DUF3108 domain-containing protein [Bryobacterales bacterium]